MNAPADKEKRIMEAASRYFMRLAEGVCPICDAKIEDNRQVGRCIYAEPCGHRVMQGQLKEARAERKRGGS